MGGDLIPFPPGKNIPPVRLDSTTIILFLGIAIPFTTNYSSKKKCTKKQVNEEQVCIPSEALNSTSLYGSIMDRIKYGVHENTPLQYHGIGGLITAVQRKNEKVRCLRTTKAGRRNLFLCQYLNLMAHSWPRGEKCYSMRGFEISHVDITAPEIPESSEAEHNANEPLIDESSVLPSDASGDGTPDIDDDQPDPEILEPTVSASDTCSSLL